MARDWGPTADCGMDQRRSAIDTSRTFVGQSGSQEEWYLGSRRGEVDGQRDNQAAGDGGFGGGERGRPEGDLPRKAYSQERTEAVSADCQHEKAEPCVASQVIQIRRVGDGARASQAGLLHGHMGPQRGIPSRSPQSRGAALDGHQMETEVLRLSSAAVRVLPVAVGIYQSHEGGPGILEEQRTIGGWLHRRLHSGGTNKGAGFAAEGYGHHANAGYARVGQRTFEGILGSYHQGGDLGADIGFGEVHSGGTGEEGAGGARIGRQVGGSPTGVSKVLGRSGRQGCVSGQGLPVSQGRDKIILSADRRCAQGTVAMGFKGGGLRPGEGRCAMDPRKHAAVLRETGLETIQVDGGVHRCKHVGLGSGIRGSASRGRQVVRGGAAVPHQHVGVVGHQTGGLGVSGSVEREECVVSNRQSYRQGVFGKGRQRRSGEAAAGKGNLEPVNHGGLHVFGGMDSGLFQSSGRRVEQGLASGRLGVKEGGVLGNSTAAGLGPPLGGSLCGWAESPVASVQRQGVVSRGGSGRCIHAGLERGEKLVMPEFWADSKGFAASAGMWSSGSDCGAGVARPALVASAVPVGSGMVPIGKPRFRTGSVRSGGTLEEPSVEILGSEGDRFIVAARAPSTVATYKRWLLEFAAFCASVGESAMPAAPESVKAFIIQLFNSGRGMSAKTCVAAVKAQHLDAGLADPTDNHQVRLVLEGGLRLLAQNKPWPREREPFPVVALKKFVDSPLDGSAFVKCRDAALVALGMRAMLRPGEIAKLLLSDIQFRDGTLVMRLRATKADQRAERKPLHIDSINSKYCPVTLLRGYLVHRGNQQGPLFLTEKGAPLSVSAVSSVVARVAVGAGLRGLYSGHSLRIGGASAALNGGLSVDQIKSIGGWKSDAVTTYLLSRSKLVSQRMGF